MVTLSVSYMVLGLGMEEVLEDYDIMKDEVVIHWAISVDRSWAATIDRLGTVDGIACTLATVATFFKV